MDINGKRVPFLGEAKVQTQEALGKYRSTKFATGGRIRPTTKMNYGHWDNTTGWQPPYWIGRTQSMLHCFSPLKILANQPLGLDLYGRLTLHIM